MGRWLLPRGELTRDQLSSLLLVYVANAADIMGKLQFYDYCYVFEFEAFYVYFCFLRKSLPSEIRYKLKGKGI